MSILDFKHLVLSELPGNADNLVELRMLEAVKDLCRKTFAYTEVITVPSVASQASYALASTIANTKFISFVGGTYDDRELRLTDKPALDRCDPSWQILEGSPIKFVYTAGGNSVKLVRIPTEIKTMKLEIAIMPTKIISALPEVIENNYIDTIINYVKWKVYSSAPLNDLRTASLFQQEYNNGRDNLKRDILENFNPEMVVDYEGSF